MEKLLRKSGYFILPIFYLVCAINPSLPDSFAYFSAAFLVGPFIYSVIFIYLFIYLFILFTIVNSVLGF